MEATILLECQNKDNRVGGISFVRFLENLNVTQCPDKKHMSILKFVLQSLVVYLNEHRT
jgi:hypothetical protein